MIFQCCSEYRPKSRKAGWVGGWVGRQAGRQTHAANILRFSSTPHPDRAGSWANKVWPLVTWLWQPPMTVQHDMATILDTKHWLELGNTAQGLPRWATHNPTLHRARHARPHPTLGFTPHRFCFSFPVHLWIMAFFMLLSLTISVYRV